MEEGQEVGPGSGAEQCAAKKIFTTLSERFRSYLHPHSSYSLISYCVPGTLSALGPRMSKLRSLKIM